MNLTIATQIEQTLENLDRTRLDNYQKYWESISPKSDYEYYWRWIFAFLSVHTSWEKNVDSYLLLFKNLDWQKEGISQLSRLIQKSKVGLQVVRSRGIWEFHQTFWEDPNFWYKRENESWKDCRERMMNKLFGLGLAKTAFALELCYPKTCNVLCADTHIIQLYGYNPLKMNKTKYLEIERHWISTCNRLQISSPMARCLYWDNKQQQDDSRYWSYVFEISETVTFNI